MSVEDRFWAKVDQCGADECWEWQAARSGNGYGSFWVDGKAQVAHRVAWELFHRQVVPEDRFICHICDNRVCCNPAHLMLGDHQENTRQAVERGRMASGERHGLRLHPERHGMLLHPERAARGKRHGRHTQPERTARGERNGNAKLNEAQVRELRARYAAGGITKVELSRQFGIDQSLVGKIIQGKVWAWLNDVPRA